MTSTAKALYDFYSGFGIPAYTTDSVPDDVPLPYLTYSYVEPEWESSASHYVQVYMRTNSNSGLLDKAGEIVKKIGLGIRLPCKGGCVMIYPSTPLVQLLSDDSNPDLKTAYINLQLYALHMPGV